MEIIVKKAKSGDLLLGVRFEKDTNFDVEKLLWFPRLEELDLIDEAKRKIIGEAKVD